MEVKNVRGLGPELSQQKLSKGEQSVVSPNWLLPCMKDIDFKDTIQIPSDIENLSIYKCYQIIEQINIYMYISIYIV
jgi:hypothetical protein